MNILAKLGQAIRDTDEADLNTTEILSMQNHIKAIQDKRLPSFVSYSSRKIRAQLSF